MVIVKASFSLKKSIAWKICCSFADDSDISKELQIKVASSHIIPGFSVHCISAPRAPRNVSELWTFVDLDCNCFPPKIKSHQAT